MHSAVLAQIQSRAAAAATGDPEAADQLAALLKDTLEHAVEEGERAESALSDVCEFFAEEGSAQEVLPLVAMEVLFPAALCGVVSEVSGVHFQRILTRMLDTCSPREIFSAELEVVQHFARGDWKVQRRVLLPCLRALPVLLSRIHRRRHLFIPDSSSAGLAVARCLGEAMVKEQAIPNESPPSAIPPATSLEVSYAAKQQQQLKQQKLRRHDLLKAPSTSGTSYGQDAAWQSDDCAAIAEFFSGMLEVGAAGDAPMFRALLLRLLKAVTFHVSTYDSVCQSVPPVDHSSAAAFSIAVALLEHLQRLGVTAEYIFLETSNMKSWRQFWGVAIPSPDNNSDEDNAIDSEDGAQADSDGDSDSQVEDDVLAGVLLYWIFQLEEHDFQLTPTKPLELIMALTRGYGRLMEAASQWQSVGAALKALSLAARIGEPLAIITAESSVEKNTEFGASLQLLESVVMTMAHHPVHSIRATAYRAIQVAMEKVTSEQRLYIYGQLLDSAAPAAASLLLQCVQKEIMLADESRQCGCAFGSSGEVIFDLASQWMDPDGRHGWRTALMENAEPLAVVLGLLRFMLLKEQAAPDGLSSIVMIPEAGKESVRHKWLPALASASSHLLAELQSFEEADVGGQLPGRELVLMLSISRVRQLVAWLQDLLD